MVIYVVDHVKSGQLITTGQLIIVINGEIAKEPCNNTHDDVVLGIYALESRGIWVIGS